MNPSFYDPGPIGELRFERPGVVAAEAEKYPLPEAANDKFKALVFGIDPQMGFCSPWGSLYVPGAVDDMRRTIEWIYSNIGRITKFVISLDTHAIHQVFHSAFWLDKDGKCPAPFTVISSKDIEDGKWTPNLPGQKDFKDLKRSMINYASQLEKGGKYSLTIWPYHTLLGSASHIVVPSLMEAIMYHSMVRRTDPSFVVKGSNPYTENFSVISPEVTSIADGVMDATRVGQFNTGLVDTLKTYDRIYVFGQAKSHCVLSTLMSLHTVYGADKAFMSKIYILEDTMSAIPAPPIDPLPDALNYPKVTEEAFAMFAKVGMHRVSTKEPKE